MEFEFKTSGYFYPDKKKRDQLEKYGFTFVECPIRKQPRIGVNQTITINKVEELMDLVNEFDCELIIGDCFIEINDAER